MTIQVRPFSALDVNAVQAAVTITVQRVQEANPNLDVRRGVFAELLAYYHAVLDTQREQYTTDLLNARSLLKITQDPALADPDAVNDVLSNFRVTRQPGSLANGEVTVVVSSDITVTIAEGSSWIARGKQYLATQVFTAKAESAQINSSGDRLLTATSDGNWAFTIEVQAVADGPEYNVSKDTSVLPETAIPNYVTSFATSDFNVGVTAETNEELIARLQAGIASPALSNRGNMAAFLRSVTAFSRVVSMSIVGYGDAELVRAFHSILPIACGGKCDWYVRTQEHASELTLSITATLISKNTDNSGVWQFSLGRDVAPGFFEFRNIRPADSDPSVGGYTIITDTRGMDLSSTSFVPDIINPVEAAYTMYSTAVVQFVDTRDHSTIAVGAKQSYSVSVVYLPSISDIQLTVSSRNVTPYGGDALVKAPVPCFVQVGLTVVKRTGQPDPDISAMQTAVAAAVNKTGFVGALYASQIQDAIGSLLIAGQVISGIDIFGRIRYPDGSLSYLRDPEVIQVVRDPGNMVTEKTVQFFCNAENVSIAVVTRLPTNL